MFRTCWRIKHTQKVKRKTCQEESVVFSVNPVKRKGPGKINGPESDVFMDRLTVHNYTYLPMWGRAQPKET